MPTLEPDLQRQFAVDVVRKLRDAGHRAYWAGGCVRDQLLGRTPKDYDVASDARPEQVRGLFGHRRTLAIGAAFGVIAVLGPPGAGQIEVATFRSDGPYSDGRRPDEVVYSSPEEDASRRDFTINALFYDPLDDRVIDYVGGREDIARGLLRAVGEPVARFEEDKLRMLRAVRFTARFQFALDPGTLAAIRAMAAQIGVVSAERIAAEMQSMLVDVHRAHAVRLLFETHLVRQVLPEIAESDPVHQQRLAETLEVLERLERPSFPLALAALVGGWVDGAGAEAIGRRWRLSNPQIERLQWLVEHQRSLDDGRRQPWSQLQKVLAAEGADDLLDWKDAEAQCGRFDRDLLAWCRGLRNQPRERLDPPPLVGGDDLKTLGPPGPWFRRVLAAVRDAQLDGQVHTREQGLELAQRLLKSEPATMDKRAKKRIDAVQQRVQRLRQQLSGARKQNDDPQETAALQRQVAEAEAELAKLKAEGI